MAAEINLRGRIKFIPLPDWRQEDPRIILCDAEDIISGAFYGMLAIKCAEDIGSSKNPIFLVEEDLCRFRSLACTLTGILHQDEAFYIMRKPYKFTLTVYPTQLNFTNRLNACNTHALRILHTLRAEMQNRY